jgi:hypothetical protein
MVSILLTNCAPDSKIFSTCARSGLWAGWLGVTGVVPHNSGILPGTLPNFVRSRISIIEAFLTLGTTDPADPLSHVPSGFTLCPESLYVAILAALDETCFDVVLILETIQRTLRGAILRWANQNCGGQSTCKRKHGDETETVETTAPDLSTIAAPLEIAGEVQNKRRRQDSQMAQSQNGKVPVHIRQTFWEAVLS